MDFEALQTAREAAGARLVLGGGGVAVAQPPPPSLPPSFRGAAAGATAPSFANMLRRMVSSPRSEGSPWPLR